MNTPLLPRPWLCPFGGVGADHSMCNWQSPKLSFVLMSPWPTVATPFLTFQFSPFSHFDRSLPSKRTVASEGGSAFVLPGATTGGSCHSIPEWYSCAKLQLAVNKADTVTMENWINVLPISGTHCS